MKKTWSIVLVLILLIVGGGLIGLRLIAGTVVQSDEFRLRFNGVLERSLRTVLPWAMTDIKEIRLTGLASLELHDVTVRSSKHLETMLAAPRTRLTPDLWSLFGKGPLGFEADSSLANGGRVSVTGGVPIWALSAAERSDGDRTGELTLDGTLTQVNAATVAALFFPGEASPNARLTKGIVTGTFSVLKPFGGTETAGKKHGRVDARLEGSEWALAGSGEERTLALPPFDVALTLDDYTVAIRQPIVLKEKNGEATLSGALRLPELADGTPKWDMNVRVIGDSGLAAALGRILRCKTLPAGPQFLVAGPVAEPACS